MSPYAVAGDVENQRLNSRGSSAADSAEKVALPETQSLWYMAQSKEHRHLLKHPVVTSFLHMKWDRIRRHFNFNLREAGFDLEMQPILSCNSAFGCIMLTYSPGSTFSSCSS